jgi:O-antigen ligase
MASLAAAVFSFDPYASFVDIKKLLLFAIPYLVVSALRRESHLEALVLLLIGVADVAALVSLWQYFFGDLGDLDHRIRGFMSHYMTFSGLLMEVSILALAWLAFRGRWLWLTAGSFTLMFSVLVLSLTRSAWLGLAVAIVLLLALRKRILLLALPVLAVAAFLLLPPEVDSRLRTFLRPDVSGQDRFYMLQSAGHMVATHPWFGVGPDMVSHVYPIYMVEGAPPRANVHLHNNVAQIASERGLLALIAWLWLMGTIVLWAVRAYRRSGNDKRRRAFSAAALGVVAASLIAGLFEYNFGDSEFLMLFLFISAFPFALERHSFIQPL